MDHSALDHDQLWDSCIQILRADPSVSDRHIGFLTLSRLKGFLDDTALIAVPSALAKDIVETRIPDPVRAALSQATGRDTRFAVAVDETLIDTLNDDDFYNDSSGGTRPAAQAAPRPISSAPSAVEADESPFARQLPADEETEPAAPDTAWASGAAPAETPQAVDNNGSSMGTATRLNPKYTFDTFVIGASNRFAQAAAFAVAEQPAMAYNPLFIYGGSGLGKTHLLHATGHYAVRLHPNIHVRYVNSEEFTNDFINSVQSGQFGRAQEFQRRYRDIDILLIDDIQFLQRAPETMEAFFHTFNTLHNANKQIVITSDLPPKQLGGFENRMRSRFEMGLMTDVQPPDLETRIAILRKKVTAEGADEVPHDVLEYIAQNISTNIRELEGALIRVQALHSLSRVPMEVSLAESVLKDLLTHEGSAEITAQLIIQETASYFGLTQEDIKGTARTRALVTARQVAMYLCRELTEMPLMAIGNEFGGRDHTTVIHANKKITQLMKERRSLFNQVSELTMRIKSTAQEADSSS